MSSDAPASASASASASVPTPVPVFATFPVPVSATFAAAQQFFEKFAASASSQDAVAKVDARCDALENRYKGLAGNEVILRDRIDTLQTGVTKQLATVMPRVEEFMKRTNVLYKGLADNEVILRDRIDTLQTGVTKQLATVMPRVDERTDALETKVQELAVKITETAAGWTLCNENNYRHALRAANDSLHQALNGVQARIAKIEERIGGGAATSAAPVVPVAPAKTHPYDSTPLAKEVAAAMASTQLILLTIVPKKIKVIHGPGYAVADSRGIDCGYADPAERVTRFLGRTPLGGFDLSKHSLVLAGGAVSGIIYGNAEDEDPKDYDLFFVGEQTEASIKAAVEAYAAHAMSATDEEVDIHRTDGCYTVVDRGSRTVVQFIQRHYPTMHSVIQDFDLGSCMYLWSGTVVWTNALGLLAAKYRTNVLNPGRVRCSYWSRVAKYFGRGFGLVLPYCKPLPERAEIGKLLLTYGRRGVDIESLSPGAGSNGEPFSYLQDPTDSNLENPTHPRSKVLYTGPADLDVSTATCNEKRLEEYLRALVTRKETNIAKCRRVLSEQDFKKLMEVKLTCVSKQAELALLTELFLTPVKIAERAAAIRAQVIPFVIKKQGEGTAADAAMTYREIYGELYYE